MITAIHKHINSLQLERESIRTDDLKTILNHVYEEFQKKNVNNIVEDVTNLKAMQYFCKQMMENKIYRNMSHLHIAEHSLFSLMADTLSSIIEKSHQNEREWSVFHAMASLLYSILLSTPPGNPNKLINKCFLNGRFIAAVKSSIDHILLVDDIKAECFRFHILNYMFNHAFNNIIISSDKQLRANLLDSIIHCILSKYYVQQWKFSDKIIAKFFLLDCPNFLLKNYNDCQEYIVNIICQPMLSHSTQMLSHRSKLHSVKLDSSLEKDGPDKGILYYLQMLNLCAVIESTRVIFTQYPLIVENLFEMAKSCLCFDPKMVLKEIQNAELLSANLTLLYNLMENSTMFDMIRKKAPPALLLLLCSVNGSHLKTGSQKKRSTDLLNNIHFPARSITALMLHNIDELQKPEDITSSYIFYIAKSVKNPAQMNEGVHLSSLVTHVKAFAQNKNVKVQLVEQKGLPLLTKCACDDKLDESSIKDPALNAIWTVSFNQKARDLWKNDKQFVEYLRLLLKSDRKEQQQAADGILWRLIYEAKFKAKHTSVERTLNLSDGTIEDTVKDESDAYVLVKGPDIEYVKQRGNLTANEQILVDDEIARQNTPQKKDDLPYTYDLMISYCHKDKALCHVIYDCLMKTGKYKIWIDKNEMHGSLMERMAEAIEESHIILICMSEEYKLSQPCQAEAEYAFSRKRHLIFLKMEPEYKPNGWLGILLGTKYYTDFTKPDFESKFKDLFQQINRKRKETCDYTLINSIVTPKILESVNAALSPKKQPVVPSQINKPNTAPSNNSDHLTDSTIRIPSAKQSVSIASRKNSSASSSSKAAPSPIQPHEHTQKTITTVEPISVRQHQTSTNVPFLNIPISSTPRSNNNHSPIPPIFSKSANSTPMVSARGELQETPINPIEINGESYNPEELNYDELYPSDFDYDIDEEDLLNSVWDKMRENARTPLSSISSVSDDEIEDHILSSPVLNVRSSIAEVVSTPPTINQTEIVATSTASYKEKPIDQWTQQDVLKFFKEKNLHNMLEAFGDDELNGKHLLELYDITKPMSVSSYLTLKRKLNTLAQISIPRVEYERFLNEVEQLIPLPTNSQTVVCNIM